MPRFQGFKQKIECSGGVSACRDGSPENRPISKVPGSGSSRVGGKRVSALGGGVFMRVVSNQLRAIASSAPYTGPSFPPPI